jgi:hypothetical protein
MTDLEAFIGVTLSILGFLALIVGYGRLLDWWNIRRGIDPITGEPLHVQTPPKDVSPSAPASTPVRVTSPTPTAPPIEHITPLAIARSDNILIVGGKGSGKTTLLHALLALRAGDHLVFDPHNYPGKWQHQVVGGGGEYEEIRQYLDEASRELKRRQQQLNEGIVTEGQFPHLTLVADEWRAIVQELDGAGKEIARLLTQGRKFGIAFLAVSHNDTVASLGVAGDKEATMASFDWIIYTGAFAAKRWQQRGIDTPSFTTPTGTTSPLWVVAHNTGSATDHLLDMRNLDKSQHNAQPQQQAILLPSVALEYTAPPQPGAPIWTEHHIKVAQWLAQEPEISNREIARRLWNSKSGGGNLAMQAGEIRRQVEAAITEPISQP